MKNTSKILIIIGFILVLGTMSLNFYTRYKDKQGINNLRQKIESKSKNSDNDINLGDEIAIIEIDSLNISSVVVRGTNKEQINHYIGHFENTSMPGENGNFCIAGHSSTIYNQVFNNLKKISKGEKIVITTIDGKFTYKVNEVFETDPSNVGVLNQDNSIKEMTIVTCTKNGKERLIVKATLDEEAAYEN